VTASRIPAFDASRLDNPIWSALTSEHATFAEGSPLAKRYPSDIAPFAGTADRSAAAGAALRELARADEEVCVFTPERVAPPEGLEVEWFVPMEQMVATTIIDAAVDGVEIAALSSVDAQEMHALAALTHPGPFGPRSHVLGRWLGIRVNGALVAMAGERLRFPGHVEVSGVCVHPDHRRGGYARALVAAAVRRAAADGLVPFLHVRSDNTSAIALYRRLRFDVRRQMYATVMRQTTL
jgi:ribosomal protein S18 acetylase RimI-like enzyme